MCHLSDQTLSVPTWAPLLPMDLGGKEEVIHKTPGWDLSIFMFSRQMKVSISFEKREVN